jgi:D-alanyl-D-alanine carboxypeptidase
MHRTGYVSHHNFNIVIKNDIRARRLITVTLNPKKIVNSDVKCTLIYESDINQWSTYLCIG